MPNIKLLNTKGSVKIQLNGWSEEAMRRCDARAAVETDDFLIDPTTHPVLFRKLWLVLQLLTALSGLNQKAGAQSPSAWRSHP